MANGNGQNVGSVLFESLAKGVQGVQAGLEQKRQNDLQNLMTALQVQQADQSREAFLMSQRVNEKRLQEADLNLKIGQQKLFDLASGKTNDKTPASIEAEIASLVHSGIAPDDPRVTRLVGLKQSLLKQTEPKQLPSIADLGLAFGELVRDEQAKVQSSKVKAELEGLPNLQLPPVDVVGLFSSFIAPKAVSLGIDPQELANNLLPAFPSLRAYGVSGPQINARELLRGVNAGNIRLEELTNEELDAIDRLENGE